MRFFLLWLVPLLIAHECESVRILALFPFPGKSHFISFQNYLEELVKRGHQLTVISAFPRKTPLPNYTDISYENYFESNDDNRQLNVFDKQDMNPILMRLIMRPRTWEMCEYFLMSPAIQDFINNNDHKFDLIIYEPFLMECTYGILNKFRVPTIHISSNTIAQWMGDGVGNPYIYSYMPEIMLGYTDHMSFLERLINSFSHVVFELQRNFIDLPKMHEIACKVFNDTNIPNLREIETNASLLLLNSNAALNFPRPFTPNTIEVGGMHIKPPQKLPENLQKLLDESKNGVIYFSLGTNARGSHMPEKIRQVFVSGFSKIEQTVLWKFDLDSLPNLSKNVHLGKWFPQNEILAHPNVKAFITHGGLLSAQEATFLGMPLIVLPLMADQKQNSMKAVAQGYAISFDIRNITVDHLVWAINEIIGNSQYRQKAKQLSTVFGDQLQKPLDKAIFWTEYVLRHNGAAHMRSASLDLGYIEYLLLDVIAVIVLVCTIGFIFSMMICRTIYRILFPKKESEFENYTKKNN